MTGPGGEAHTLSVSRLIPAPATPIFDLLADPHGHTLIDGSGTVRASRSGSRRLALGDRFGMDMRLGVPYSMGSTVVEFEEDARIAWQTFGHPRLSRLLGGRIWRYVLEPSPGGTLVTHSWDLSREAAPSRPVVRAALGSSTARNMNATLARIEERVAGAA